MAGIQLIQAVFLKASKKSAVEIVLSASTDTLPDFLKGYENEKVE